MKKKQRHHKYDKMISNAQHEVQNSLQFLATCSSKELFMEYLYLVEHIMNMYEEYVEALRNDELEKALEVATSIVTKIDLEKNNLMGDRQLQNN